MPAAAVARIALVAALAAPLALVGSASAALERAEAVSLRAPARIVQGATVTFTATVRSGVRCTLVVRYRSGMQRVGPSMSANGRAVFTFKVAQRAAPGRATATATCAPAGRATKNVVVIGAVLAPKINVLKSGFSIRPHRVTGSTVSWGVVLQNTSTTTDAVNATVLANMVLPDSTLIGSTTRRVGRIYAGATQVVGGDLTFRGVPPIVRVEIVVQVREGEKATRGRKLPAFENQHPVPDILEPAYVGSVEGELANDDLDRALQRAELYTVALDAQGNVLGGGTGYAIASLPPGARQFFKISGLRGVQIAQAASLMMSVVPTYAD